MPKKLTDLPSQTLRRWLEGLRVGTSLCNPLGDLHATIAEIEAILAARHNTRRAS